MNRKLLLEAIWQEKRGKNLSNEKYPIGINISSHAFSLLDPRRVLVDILKLLHSEPETAFEWSRNWGRTVCTVHPAHAYAVFFSEFRGQHERLGAMIQSARIARWCKSYPSIRVGEGRFLIELADEPTTHEALFLQIERMLDELVWCLCQHLRSAQSCAHPAALYQTAAVIVQARGVLISWTSTSEMLRNRIHNPGLIVRMYGNVMGNGALPTVIGAIDPRQFEEVCVPRMGMGNPPVVAIQSAASRKGGEIAPTHHVSPQTKQVPSTRPAVLATAITVGKRAHLGHILTGVVAEAARLFCRSDARLVIDANDDSASMVQVVLRLAELRGTDIQNMVEQLVAGVVEPSDIETAYVTRALYRGPAITAPNLPPLCFSRMSDCIQTQFADLGIQSELRCASARRARVDQLVHALRACNMPRGFSHCLVKKGKRVRLHVLEKQGKPTASVVRASLSLDLEGGNGAVGVQRLVVFDQDSSVHQAVELLRAYDQQWEAIVQEGVGVGIGDRLGSASSGTSVSVSEALVCLDHVVEPSLRFATLLHWVHMSEHMAPSAHEKPISPPNPLGPSFICFGSIDAVRRSLVTVALQAQRFAQALRALISSLTSPGVLVSLGGAQSRLVSYMARAQADRFLARPEAVRLSRRCEEVRKVALTHARVCSAEVDLAISKHALCAPDPSAQELMRTLRIQGLVHEATQVPRRLNGPVPVRHVELFLEKGYVRADIPGLAQRALSGDLGLYRRRVLPLEYAHACLVTNTQPGGHNNMQAHELAEYQQALEHVAEVCKISL